MIVPTRRVCVIVAVISLLVLAAAPARAQAVKSEHEQSNFEQYTNYESMMKYLEKIRATSHEMVLGVYGQSLQGRDMAYAVFSNPPVSQPWEAATSGKPIVVLAANVHGGERTLRESLLIMAREAATQGTALHGMLDKIVLVIVPSINPDGFEALPRPTRGNALNIDMNRDYIKLEQPELAAYVKNVLHTWHPHVVVDGHNGCAFPYNVCYQGPSMASSDPRLTEVCDQEIFPLINKRMAASSYRSWYYSGGDEKVWRTGGFDARIGRNYSGLINSIGILFESPGGQPGEMATRSGIVAYQSVVEFVAANPARVRDLVTQARLETITAGKNAQGEVVVQMKYDPEDYKVSYLIGGGTGRGWDRPIVEVKDAQILKKPVPTKTQPRPYAYLLEARSVAAVEMLRRHDLFIEVLTEDTEMEVSYYRIDREVNYAHEYDHPASASVKVVDSASKKVTFPKGTYVIQTGQPLGRVVTHMLEPETNDNVVKWNTMDFMLPVSATRRQAQATDEEERRPQANPQQQARREPLEFPIYKLMKPQALPTRVLR